MENKSEVKRESEEMMKVVTLLITFFLAVGGMIAGLGLLIDRGIDPLTSVIGLMLFLTTTILIIHNRRK